MSLTFYNTLKIQPDLQDVMVYLKAPLDKLKRIEHKLKNSSEKDSLINSELLDKVTKLKDKHLLQLIDNYCKLDLEYRNTVIIKEDKINNQIIKYTSKDILLQNLSKLIEEVDILGHKLKIEHNNAALPENPGIKESEKTNHIDILSDTKSPEVTNNITYEIEQENNSPLNIEKEAFIKKEEDTQEYKVSLSERINYFFSGSAGELRFFLLFIILSTLMVFTLYSKVQLTNYTNMTEKMISDMMIGAQKEYPQKDYKGINEIILYEKGHMDYKYGGSAYHNGTFITPFGGQVNIKSNTIIKKDDSFIINADLIPEQACAKIATKLQAQHPKLMKINEKIVIKDGFIDPYKVAQACSFDHNNFTIIN